MSSLKRKTAGVVAIAAIIAAIHFLIGGAAPPLWNGDLSTGNLSQFSLVQGCPGPTPPRGAYAVTSPVKPGYSFSAAMDVADNSVHAFCPNLGSPGHPNVGILSRRIIAPGNDYYIGFSTLLPASFPSSICPPPWRPGCWFQIFEMYGPPFGGPPPVSIGLYHNLVVFNTSQVKTPSNLGGGNIWQTPYVRGSWFDIVIHVHAATDSTGYVEVWYNGAQQKFFNGATRMSFPTLKPGVNWNGSPNYGDFDQYRGAVPAMGEVIIYHAAMRIASTLQGATP